MNIWQEDEKIEHGESKKFIVIDAIDLRLLSTYNVKKQTPLAVRDITWMNALLNQKTNGTHASGTHSLCRGDLANWPHSQVTFCLIFW